MPGLLHPALIRDGLSSNNLVFFFFFFLGVTLLLSRSVIPAVTGLWNDLSNHVVESVQFQELKCGANVFLSRLF